MSGQADRVSEIAARLEAATPGPWFVDRGGEIDEPFWQVPDVLRDRYGKNSISSNDEATIRLIAAAPDDVAWLLAEVARLSADIERVRAIHWCENPNTAHPYCRADEEDWPCPTIRALSGDTEGTPR